jgi:hypothetical protein
LLVSRGDRFPAFAAAVSAAATDRAAHDQAWEFGLERIMDGLEAYLGRR